MMNDYHVPMWGVLAAIGWLGAAALMIAGWLVLLDKKSHAGIMLGLTAVFVSAVAASLTAQVIAGEVMTHLDDE